MVSDLLPSIFSRAARRPGDVREVADLAYPIVLTQLSYTVMGLVDSAFVGRLGATELGALGFGGIWLWTAFCVFYGCASGVQTFVSQAHGAGRSLDCGRWTWQAAWAVVPAAALALSLLTYLGAEPLLRLLGPSPELQRHVLAYVRMRPPGLTGVALWMVLASFFRGLGDTRTPLRATLAANGVNAVLDWALVFGHLGLPRLGIAGAGLATSIAEWIGALWLAVAFLSRPLDREYATRPVAPRRREIARFLRTGAPIGGQWLLDMSAFALFNTLIARMGDRSMAASQAMLSLLSLSFMQAIGVGLAAATLVGRYKGAGDPASAERAYRSALRLGFVLAAAVATLFVATPGLLLRIYTDDAALIELGRPLLALGAAFQLFDAIGIIAGGTLRGAGDTRWPFLVQTTLAWTLRLPLAWTLAVALGGGVLGAWFGECGYVIALGSALTLRFRSGAWRTVRI